MATMTQHTGGMFCWSELATPDPKAAKEFYPSLFGWTPEDTPMGDGESYTLLKKGGREVGALYQQPKDPHQKQLGPNWMPYIAVDHADTAATRIRQNGGKVLVEPADAMDYG